ncbi:hypothetical protein RFI_25042 [Reticulomyxa filosa]|uniref:Uncharacterized protein n=1 Tax=Reticulomyxa filosa TaxID=46433 RepID=X6MEA1_RETFI|nr:hypothetical protein RFI_25042 [Reticulomyxa filosa]|eukprot:ETO12333.1 hypothetical protein RFI_25042 [Reticulomyxa filosa]
MAKQTTTQNAPKKKTEQSRQITTQFQTLKGLPTPLTESQCVLHKHELLICGVKLVDSNSNNYKHNNKITLLSFGGFHNHILVMKYVSVWSDDNNKDGENEMNKSKQSNKLNKSNNYNQWFSITDDHSNTIIIGRDHGHCYLGARALIGGINNHLLFITYEIKDISVFDLNTFQFIKHDTLPTNNSIRYHCFVSKSANGQVQEMMKTNEKNKQNYQMLLFCLNTGLSIEYDEDNNTFQLHLPVCESIVPFDQYAYVCVSMISSCSLVDGMMLHLLFQNHCTSIRFEKTNVRHLKTLYPIHY